MREIASLSEDELAELGVEVRIEYLRRRGDWRICDRCGDEFLARTGARFCSGRCRTGAYRARLRGAA